MIWLSEFALLAITVGIAAWHAHLIKQNRPIQHGWWALLYDALVGGAALLLWDQLSMLQVFLYVIAQFCGHLVVFNVALNRFRGLSWTYVSKTSTSIIDQAELRLFGSRVWLLEVLLGVAFIALNFFL